MPETVSAAIDRDLAPHLPVIRAVRAQQPLVHCVVNTVAISIVANGLLASGARPMMTETRQEGPTLTRLASATLINLGTLSTDAMEGIPAIVGAAVEEGRPWILDPTAVGAAPVRTPLARTLLESGPRVVRGNASEVSVLAGATAGGRGADSLHTPDDAAEAAVLVAARTGGAVAVSGADDLIVHGERRARVARGSAMLPRVTGTGCLLGALTAACCAVEEDPLAAAVASHSWLAIAGERAAQHAAGPGTFAVALLDALDEIGAQA